MAVNPFLIPFVMDLHGFSDLGELTTFLVGGHFATGHATGFGKLIDEKVLPNVFGTTRLSAQYRREHKPFERSIFDEIDHIVPGTHGTDLLSLKAGRWTIQLTMAVQLNAAFNDIIKAREQGSVKFHKIVLGVFYGTMEGLTDKFDIARGINRGKRHTVVDLTQHVEVLAGGSFWAWLNGGEPLTQDWVLEGLLKGLRTALREFTDLKQLTEKYRRAFEARLAKHVDKNGNINWLAILKEINA